MDTSDKGFISVFGIFLISFLVGCSTAAAPKPQEAPMQPQPQAAIRKPLNATTSSSASSLEAHREGNAPASGPLKDIYFDFDRYNLSADTRDILEAHAEWLKGKPAARVEIEGHCDERGTDEYNLALGAKRAQTAKDNLVTLGVAEARITTISYGKELPVCAEHTENCWQKNRHDRFVVKNGWLSAGTF